MVTFTNITDIRFTQPGFLKLLSVQLSRLVKQKTGIGPEADRLRSRRWSDKRSFSR